MLRKSPTGNAVQRCRRLAYGISAAGAILVFGCIPAAAASGTQIMTGSTSGGVLSISAPATLILPTLVAGSSTTATNLGSVSWTDTMNDSVVSSVTLARRICGTPRVPACTSHGQTSRLPLTRRPSPMR
jgi:hypothetical protein